MEAHSPPAPNSFGYFDMSSFSSEKGKKSKK
jgi:hypothetical protein